jgi:hypothetical protein
LGVLVESPERRKEQRAKTKDRKKKEGRREVWEIWRVEGEVPKSEQARRKTKAKAARMVRMVRRVGLWWSGLDAKEWVGVAADEDKVCVHLRIGRKT